MKISVFGLGYVGVVNIACLSKLGHHLIGCDVKPHKVDLIKNGNSTIYEPEVDELLKTALKEGRLSASTDAAQCVQASDMSIVCVGTPSDAEGKVNLDYILNTSTQIAKAIQAGSNPHIVVFRSTIPPGTTEDMIVAEFKRVLGEQMRRAKVV